MRETVFRGDYPCTTRNILCCPFVWITCACCCKCTRDACYETQAEYSRRKAVAMVTATNKNTEEKLAAVMATLQTLQPEPVIMVHPGVTIQPAPQ